MYKRQGKNFPRPDSTGCVRGDTGTMPDRGSKSGLNGSTYGADISPVSYTHLIREAFKKLYEGDEDGAVEAMDKISEMQGAKRATQAPEVDPQAIAAQVRQQLDVESAYSETRLDYPELFSDTERGVVLGKATMERIDAKKSQGISGGQALRESAEEIAALFGVKKTGRQQTRGSSTARDTKLERKANLDSLDSANVVAGGKTAPAENQDVHSAIAEMARGRLGQSLGGAG